MRRDNALQRRFLAAIAEERAKPRDKKTTASAAGPRVRARAGRRRARGKGSLR
jgi:hypothetical protein